MVDYVNSYETDWEIFVLNILKPHLFKIFVAVVGLLIAAQVYFGVRDTLSLAKPITLDTSVVIKPQATPLKQAVALATNTHLFGEYIPEHMDASGVMPSQLNLTVVGILFAPAVKDSRVMFELPGNQVKTYGLGDELPGGGVIKRITEDGILLTRNGGVERLTLPKNELPLAPIPKALALNEMR